MAKITEIDMYTRQNQVLLFFFANLYGLFLHGTVTEITGQVS